MALDLKADLEKIPEELKAHLGKHWKVYSLGIGVAGLAVSWLIYKQGQNPATTSATSLPLPTDLVPDPSGGGGGGSTSDSGGDSSGDGGGSSTYSGGDTNNTSSGRNGVFQMANLPALTTKVKRVFQKANLPAQGSTSSSGGGGVFQKATGIVVPNPLTGGQPSIFPISNPDIVPTDSFGSARHAILPATPGAAPNAQLSTGYVATLLHPRQVLKLPRTLQVV